MLVFVGEQNTNVFSAIIWRPSWSIPRVTYVSSRFAYSSCYQEHNVPSTNGKVAESDLSVKYNWNICNKYSGTSHDIR